MSGYNHICFASDQNVAELLGALLPDFQAGRLHILATPEKEKQAAWLEKACAGKWLKCVRHPLPLISIGEIHNLLNEIWFQQPESKWAVNITGGTKIMALAAFTWAAGNGIPAFYIDTGGKKILVCENGAWLERPLPDILDYETLLHLYGYEIENMIKMPVAQNQRKAMDKMLELLNSGVKGKTAFHALNAIAQKALGHPSLEAGWSPSPLLQNLLDICAEAGKLEYDDSIVRFHGEEARAWCNGLWLEEYVRSILARLESEGKIRSWASSAEVAREGARNELDAIFTAGNRLRVIECKTSKLEGGSIKADSILYKAETLRGRLGGIFTTSMLCSLADLNDADKNRANGLGIKTVIGANLKNLREILLQWIN